MAVKASNRRLLLIGAATCLVLLLTFTGHRNPEVVSQLKDKALQTVGLPVEHPPWLIATISPVHGIQRRTIIRSTWQTLFANSSRFTTRFVMAKVDKLWEPLIEAENKTYGDLITIPKLKESKENANSVKPMTFFSYLVNVTSPERPWSFVSKVDDDSFLDPNAFWDKYLQPKLDKHNATQTIWGRRMGEWDKGYTWIYPGGQFYTMTWDIVTNITKYWNKHGSEGTWDEDALIGALLNRSKVGVDFVRMSGRGAHDFGGEGNDGPVNDQTAWAQKSANMFAGSHGVGPKSFNVHQLKKDEDYLKVAACYDKDGPKVVEWAQAISG